MQELVEWLWEELAHVEEMSRVTVEDSAPWNYWHGRKISLIALEEKLIHMAGENIA